MKDRNWWIVFPTITFTLFFIAAPIFAAECPTPEAGQTPHPPACVVDPALTVETLNAGQLVQPVGMAFLAENDFFIIEKGSGKVKRVQLGAGGAPTVTEALDLAVNSNSERGLLGIALHPGFKTNHWVYLYWTESSTGSDSSAVSEVPVLGNRVDRFIWDGSTLKADINLIRLRSYQEDKGTLTGTAPDQTISSDTALRGNHNGGKIVFASRNSGDSKTKDKLFILIGDNGRRGQMQNLRNGPPASSFSWTAGGGVDDGVQFGGPQPDNAHLTGVVLRLNDDGTAPEDNPFFSVGDTLEKKAQVGSRDSEIGANLKKIYSYGVRNSFGLTIDPYSGRLWESENGDSAYDEINLIEKGMNGGWIQIMGPASRVLDFKIIEFITATVVNPGSSNEFVNWQAALQQYRWPPSEIADQPVFARSRLFRLPGARYRDPKFSWRYVNPPAGIGFVLGDKLGSQYRGNLLVGNAGGRQTVLGGFLYRFQLNNARTQFRLMVPYLRDRVADNDSPFDVTESESLVFGKNFGVVTDIQTGPDGQLYIVAIARPLIGNGPAIGPGTIYKIRRGS